MSPTQMIARCIVSLFLIGLVAVVIAACIVEPVILIGLAIMAACLLLGWAIENV